MWSEFKCSWFMMDQSRGHQPPHPVFKLCPRATLVSKSFSIYGRSSSALDSWWVVSIERCKNVRGFPSEGRWLGGFDGLWPEICRHSRGHASNVQRRQAALRLNAVFLRGGRFTRRRFDFWSGTSPASVEPLDFAQGWPWLIVCGLVCGFWPPFLGGSMKDDGGGPRTGWPRERWRTSPPPTGAARRASLDAVEG